MTVKVKIFTFMARILFISLYEYENYLLYSFEFYHPYKSIFVRLFIYESEKKISFLINIFNHF